MKEDKNFKNKTKKYFPLTSRENLLPRILRRYLKIIDKKIINRDSPRLKGESSNIPKNDLIKKYSNIDKNIKDPLKVSESIIDDFVENSIRWRSPKIEHNVGAPVNSISSASYSLSMDLNIYNIDEGLAGNAIYAEYCVSNILSNLSNVKKNSLGFFTFGGTATNFYPLYIGIRKSNKNAKKEGISRNNAVLVTEDSHFSHQWAADWMGIGTSNVFTIEGKKNRTSDVKSAKNKMESLIKKGKKISLITINGGTTYDHTIDRINEFVKLRNNMVKKYRLNYKPHLHVDSVIGWSWLFFRYYDFNKNPFKIDKKTLGKIKKQYEKISEVNLADSWGVDFHKGIGGCPVPCSVFFLNNSSDTKYLSKDPSIDMHQLPRQINELSPVDYTIETSRQGGAALAALTSLHSMGYDYYQKNLANLVNLTGIMRDSLKQKKDVEILNDFSLGFVTMVRLIPPDIKNNHSKNQNDHINKYMKEFYKWDFENRISKNVSSSYSFSSGYQKTKNGSKISAIKIYPVSPHFTKKFALETTKTLISQKRKFDKEIWKKK